MAESNLNPREKARLEEERKRRSSRVKYSLIGAAIVLVAAAVFIVNSPIFTNRLAAVRVGGESYSVADANYQYQKAYSQLYSTYGSGLFQSGLPLDKQNSVFDSSLTWHEYFLDAAKEGLVQETALLKAATEAGITQLTEEEAQEVEDAISTYQLYAQSSGYDLDTYIGLNFGPGNSEKTFRDHMTRELLITRYLQELQDSFSFTDEEKDAYYQENAGDYNTVKYLYAFVQAQHEETGEAEETETDEAAPEEIVIEGADAEGIVIEDDGSAESAYTEEELAAALETAQAIVKAGKNEDAFRKAAEERNEQEAVETSSHQSGFLSEYEGSVTEEELAPGACFAHETEDGAYAVYVLDVDTNDYPTVSVRHILIRAVDQDGDEIYSDEEKEIALEAIQEIQEEWLAGDATEESFAQLARDRSEDQGSAENGGLYEDIYKGMMVEEFDEFCFAGHESGDYGIVYGESGSYAGYHLIYFVGEGPQYSRVLADSQLKSESYNDRFEELLEGYEAETTGMWRYVMKTHTS